MEVNKVKYTFSSLQGSITINDNSKFSPQIAQLLEMLKAKIAERQTFRVAVNFRESRWRYYAYKPQNTAELSFNGQTLGIKSLHNKTSFWQMLYQIPFLIVALLMLIYAPSSIYTLAMIGIFLFFLVWTPYSVISQKITFSKVVSVDILNRTLNVTTHDEFINRHPKFFSRFEPLEFSYPFKEIEMFFSKLAGVITNSEDDPHYMVWIKMKEKQDLKFKIAYIRNKQFANDLSELLNGLIKNEG